MLKSCFGFSTLRSGVSVMSIINMIPLVGIMFVIVMARVYSFIINDGNWDIIFQRPEMLDNAEEIRSLFMTWSDTECVSSIIYISCLVLLLITNICLKQATFKQAPHKVYAWLVVNYAVLLCLAIHFVNYIILVNKIPMSRVYYLHDHYFGGLMVNFYWILIFGVECFVVHSYYIEEKKAMLSDIIQLRWKHVSNGNVLSQGTVFPSASTFKETVSRQTQAKSKIPPFVTSVLQEP